MVSGIRFSPKGPNDGLASSIRKNHAIQRVGDWACWGALSVVLALTGCGKTEPSASAKEPPASNASARSVKVWTTEVLPKERTVKATGSLAAYEQATLAAKIQGRLQNVEIDLGSILRKGELIAQIDPTDLRLRVEQADALLAQARARLGLPLDGSDDTVEPEQTSVVRQTRAILDEAKANRDRLHELTRQGIASKSEWDTVEAAFRVAQSKHEDALEEVKNRQALLAQRRAELAIAKQELADTSVFAPYDCAIQERQGDVGEYVVLGAPIATVVRMNTLRLRLDVPERDAFAISRGQQVRLTVEGSTNVFGGYIERLSPVIDEQTRILRVEADVPNPGPLRPGGFARAEIIVETNSPTLAVPKAALSVFAGIEKVFVVEQGKAAERLVETGRSWDDSVEILQGVKPGEQVVLNPGNLRSGETLTITR
jgi:multidrug efflux pump subunit AcrA (membrane-fusion protein)